MKPTTLTKTLAPLQTWFTLLATSGRHRTRRGELDPRELSDHIKRDMGFLDGKEPAGTIR